MLQVFWEGQPNAYTELRSPLLVTQGILLLMLIVDMCMCVTPARTPVLASLISLVLDRGGGSSGTGWFTGCAHGLLWGSCPRLRSCASSSISCWESTLCVQQASWCVVRRWGLHTLLAARWLQLRRNLGLVRSILLLAMTVDWTIQCISGYATGPTVLGFTDDSPPLRVGTYMIPCVSRWARVERAPPTY